MKSISNYVGLILYNGEKPIDGDFISLGLKNGRVEFRFNVGSGPAIITAHDPITLNEWHTVRIHREKKIGMAHCYLLFYIIYSALFQNKYY